MSRQIEKYEQVVWYNVMVTDSILDFPQHLEFPAVYHLPIHLKDDQTVYFDPKDDIQDVANCPTSTKI